MTAYVDLGLPDRVSFHADQVMVEFDTSESNRSQSLIRLDLANSLVRAKDGDPTEAAGLVTAALNISAGNPIASRRAAQPQFRPFDDEVARHPSGGRRPQDGQGGCAASYFAPRNS